MTKKLIYKEVNLYKGITDLETLEEIKRKVEELIEEYGEKAELFFDSDSIISETLAYSREETDKEYEKRLKDEQKEKNKKRLEIAKKEEKERREYERLKVKFEGKQ